MTFLQGSLVEVVLVSAGKGEGDASAVVEAMRPRKVRAYFMFVIILAEPLVDLAWKI